MYIKQLQLENIEKKITPGKAIVLYGPRRCGKTTLLNHLKQNIKEKTLFVNGEDITVQEYLSSQSIEKLTNFIGNNELLIIDEAQKIKNIGLNIKLMLDHIPNIKIIASGSSSFDLSKQLGEPLTGRKFTFKLFPLSQMELQQNESRTQTEALLEERLIYGSYPEVILSKDQTEKKSYLRELVSSYLYKDILELDGIRHSDKLIKILQLLAFQIGQEVSFNEIGQKLSMSKNTVDSYLDLLEKAFVLYKLTGFSKNLRNEITKNPRFYFYDIGIRNTIINNFNPISLRDDIGMLWENYIIIERIKKQEYLDMFSNNYFWRTYSKEEIDLIEEKEGLLNGYEIKWSKKRSKQVKLWGSAYNNATLKTIAKKNYLEFIT